MDDDARKPKTFKRESAVGLLLFLGFIAERASRDDPMGVLSILAPWVMMWSAAAFGMDWVAKQTGLVK